MPAEGCFVNKTTLVRLLCTLALAVVTSTQAQPQKPYRVGVVHEGGPYNAIVEGLKDEHAPRNRTCQ